MSDHTSISSQWDRLIALAVEWQSPTAWRVMANQMAEFQSLRAKAVKWWDVRRNAMDRKEAEPHEANAYDKQIADAEQFAEQAERHAETSHRCYLDMSKELCELETLVLALAPELNAHVPSPSVDELVPKRKRYPLATTYSSYVAAGLRGEAPRDHEAEWKEAINTNAAKWAKEVKQLVGLLVAKRPTFAPPTTPETAPPAITATPTPERSEGGGETDARKESDSDEPSLTDRQQHILETMLEKGATAQSKRTTKAVIVAAIDRRADTKNFNRAFMALGRRGLSNSESGPDGGIWLTSAGIDLAKQLKSANEGT